MSHLLRTGWFVGLLFPFAAMTLPTHAADLDYSEPPPPPGYDRPIVEEPPVADERPVIEERRVFVERPAPYAEPYERGAYDPRPVYVRPARPQPYDDDVPYVEGPRPPGYVPY